MAKYLQTIPRDSFDVEVRDKDKMNKLEVCLKALSLARKKHCFNKDLHVTTRRIPNLF